MKTVNAVKGKWLIKKEEFKLYFEEWVLEINTEMKNTHKIIQVYNVSGNSRYFSMAHILIFVRMEL